MNEPAVTVLMPVHNAAPFVRAAIDSMLAQSWTDFELLVIDDGSTDGSLAAVRSVDDPRLRVVEQKPNQGIVRTLNAGLGLARGRYVARMDADDLSLPDRLRLQCGFLDAHPEVGLCGGNFEKTGDESGPGWIRFFDNDALQVSLLFENPFCHPTVMMRRDVLTRHGVLYPDDSPHAEEYALWTRLARLTRFANLPDTVLRYRVHARQVSRLHNETQCRSIERVIRGQLALLGIDRVSKGDLALHQVLGGGFYPLPGSRRRLERWAALLAAANARTRVFDSGELERQLADRVREACARQDRMLASMPLFRRTRWRVETWLRYHTGMLSRPSASR